MRRSRRIASSADPPRGSIVRIESRAERYVAGHSAVCIEVAPPVVHSLGSPQRELSSRRRETERAPWSKRAPWSPGPTSADQSLSEPCGVSLPDPVGPMPGAVRPVTQGALAVSRERLVRAVVELGRKVHDLDGSRRAEKEWSMEAGCKQKKAPALASGRFRALPFSVALSTEQGSHLLERRRLCLEGQIGSTGE
jgi:hypothetical protein